MLAYRCVLYTNIDRIPIYSFQSVPRGGVTRSCCIPTPRDIKIIVYVSATLSDKGEMPYEYGGELSSEWGELSSEWGELSSECGVDLS